MNQKNVLETAIDKLLPDILAGAKEAQEANKTVPISGTRYTLALEGRNIDIAYYKAKKEKAPLIIGLHGGGFLFGGSALDDDLWVNVSETLEMDIASVNYRMSPEVMDEACLMDAYDATLYLISHAEEFGFDPAHVSVFGSSAGGNLAAALAILAKQRGEFSLDYQILMYPFLDGASDPDSKGEGSFSGVMPHIMNRLHFSPEKAADPLLSPVYAPKEMLTGLPKAIVVYCELDNLKAEALKYCEMLKEAGVEVASYYARSMPHGYIESGFKKVFTDMDRQFMGENADELIEGGLLRRTSEQTLAFVKKEIVS